MRVPTLRCSAVASVLVLLTALPAAAQEDAWKRKNDRGNRYEGSRSALVAAVPVVEIIGFHALREPFSATDDVSLAVSFYVPDPAAARVRLTAREIVRDEFYWMEVKPQRWQAGWNHFGPWPVRDVLRPLHIAADNLAVLARLDEFRSGGGMIAPVAVRWGMKAANVREYDAFFIAGKTLDAVDYRLETERDGVVRKSGTLGRKSGASPFTIRMPIGNIPAGAMRLVLLCHIADDPGPPAHIEYRFQHQPVVPAPR